MRCYAATEVVGNSNVGAFLGSVDYSDREHLFDCFYNQDLVNVDPCGFSPCDGILAVTASEMQTASTFLDAGWDFVDETENGTDDIWWIDEGQDYPRLWWERPEGEF
jgi:hypothetical protein